MSALFNGEKYEQPIEEMRHFIDEKFADFTTAIKRSELSEERKSIFIDALIENRLYSQCLVTEIEKLRNQK